MIEYAINILTSSFLNLLLAKACQEVLSAEILPTT